MSSRLRATRLSSGSTSKRNYAEGLTSSDEDNSTPKGKKQRRASQKDLSDDSDVNDDDDDSEDAYIPKKKKGKSNGKMKSRHNESDSGSSSEFVDEEEEEEEEQESLVASEEDESEDDVPARRKKASKPSPKGKGKAVSTSNGKHSAVSSSFDVDGSETIKMTRAPNEKAPSDRISEYTLNFMRDLQDPSKNDREWFAANKNVYDYIHSNWLAFTDTCVEVMIDKVDDTIAFLPAKELVERIYRDVRFSNDKTPYKRHLSWCLSRNGKKGNYAKYYLALSANNKSGLHAGLYEASKEDLQAVREHVMNKSGPGRALRALVKDSNFVKNFGSQPKITGTGKRTSLWGSEDELKRAPKGYDPDHPDAAWLRLKSYTVSHHFTDEEVLQPDFMENLVEVARAANPLVELMNEIMHGALPTAPGSQ